MNPQNDERQKPAVDRKIQRAYVKYIVLVLALMCLFFVALALLNEFANDRVLRIVRVAKGTGSRSDTPAVVKMEKEIVDTYSTFRTKILVAIIILSAAFVYLSVRHSYKIVFGFYLFKDTVRRAADGNLSVRLELEEHDQLYELAREMNLFLETVETDYVRKETGTEQQAREAESKQTISRVEERSTATLGWKDSPVVAGIAITALILIWIALGFSQFNKAAIRPESMKIEVYAMCTQCGERLKKLTREIPADCPKCGKKRTVYTCYKCKECGHVFAFVPPHPPSDPYRNLQQWNNMSPGKRAGIIREADRQMIDYEDARMEAMKCPKCGSYDTRRLYTEEQKKRFQEMRERYLKKSKQALSKEMR